MSPTLHRSREDPGGSEADEFPDLDTLVHRARQRKKPTVQMVNKASSVRRRKLGSLPDNVLLKPWTQEPASKPHLDVPPSTADVSKSPSRPNVQLRTRKQVSTVKVTSIDSFSQEDEVGISDEVTFLDEASADDSSDFDDTASSDQNDLDDFDDWPGLKCSGKPGLQPKRSQPQGHPGTVSRARPPSRKVDDPTTGDKSGGRRRKETTTLKQTSRPNTPDFDLVGGVNRLRIDGPHAPTASRPTESCSVRPTTPPVSAPPKPRAGLVSPKKLPRIPTTPHHPSTDLFWSRDFVDDWNDEHSPKKQLFPDATKSPSKPISSPKKKGTTSSTAANRDAKKAFERSKHDIAKDFLEELDTAITQGRLSQLAETTGGIQLRWTNKLNTTAGRANWKRETVRSKDADGTEAPVKYRHHASIELAEKVIDNEHRLLNVIAHEFCHLANFMVTGITNNPHGKEFKAWAAKCSRMFGNRGIEVTTKHSYDIDFKYVWECTSCATEYKRHSKSINPDRHRCGSCKGQLKQTRPVPRAGTGKPSEYQKFMQQQMRLLREEDPKSPQKEIMKRVADRWSSLQASSKVPGRPLGVKDGINVDAVTLGIDRLKLDGAGGSAC